MTRLACLLTRFRAEIRPLLPLDDREQGPARLWRHLWPYVLGVGLSVGVGLLLQASPRHLLVLPVAFLLAGLWQGRQVARRQRAERDRVDSWLRNGVVNRAPWRVEELTSARARKRLAGNIRRMVRDSSRPLMRMTATVYERASVRWNSDLLLAVAARLDDLSRPISPQGVVLLNDVLRDSMGPLYTPGREQELAAALSQAQRFLPGS